jgi:hypothetical protein
VGSNELVARRLWQLLRIAVAVWVAAGIVLILVSDEAGIDVFSTYNPSGWEDALGKAQFIAYRIGFGSLALLAGLWLSTRMLSKPE